MGLIKMNGIRNVAIIGAGPCGLAAAKYLVAEKVFNVQVFEQKPSVGGVWAYNTLTNLDEDFSIPRTKPTEQPDTPITTADSQSPLFVSPVYDSLETNIPHILMNFTDQPFPAKASLFPGHSVVRQYLEDYADEIRPLIKLSSQILSVTKTSEKEQNDGRWDVKVLDLNTKITTTTQFDAVVVASGHYNDPFVPSIPGLEAFNKEYPTAISHSKFYKSPSSFKGKKVIVVGNSASGLDISSQICEVSQQPVIVSERSTVTVESTNTALAYKPEIAEFIPEGRKVRFSDGVVESDVDHIVFCTGYFYSFPFLQGLSPPVVTDGASALNLYQHCVYAPDPSLVFLGIPQRIVPFPVAEGQSAYVARLWAGRLPLPTEAELKDWELHMEQLRQEGQAGNIHSLKFPKDRNYINMLHILSMTAEKRAELANHGVGKIPPYWDEEKAWIRARFPLIKVASRALGEERHKIRELKQLGFDYEAEKEKEEVQTKLEDIQGSSDSLGHNEISAPPSVIIQA